MGWVLGKGRTLTSSFWRRLLLIAAMVVLWWCWWWKTRVDVGLAVLSVVEVGLRRRRILCSSGLSVVNAVKAVSYGV